ncbi:MAG: YfiR family protein [Planctomycetes bacterium]|nr:YfiR family protein [Planctomycetota bacterium]
MNMYPMRAKRLILLAALSIVAGAWLHPAQVNAASYKEGEIKAALIYNFLKFVDWPEGTFKEDNKEKKEAIRVGVVGKEAFASAEKIFKNKKIQERALKIILVTVKQLKDEKKLKGFHVLFVSAAAKGEAKKVPPRLKKSAVLTIGELEGFLEAGGIFNFVVEKKKVRFEVNLAAAEEVKIKIRSKLLRLAKRVIKPKPKNEQDARRHSNRRVARADRREVL